MTWESGGPAGGRAASEKVTSGGSASAAASESMEHGLGALSQIQGTGTPLGKRVGTCGLRDLDPDLWGPRPLPPAAMFAVCEVPALTHLADCVSAGNVSWARG